MRQESLTPLPLALLLSLLLPCIPSSVIAGDPAVVCVRESLQIEIGKDGKEARHRVEEIYAVNARGEEVDEIRTVVIFNSFPMDPQKAEVKIWNHRGARYKKNLTHFEDVGGGGGGGIFISDNRYQILRVPTLSPGDTLRIRYESKEKPFLGVRVRTLPLSDLQVGESIYQVKVPSNLEPRYQTWNGAGDPEVEQDGDKLIWTWSLQDPESYEREPLGPPAEDVLPTVSIGVNRIAWGPADSWQSLARTYWAQARDRVHALNTAELPARSRDHDSPLELCLEKTQNNIRYVAIELGVGGIIPHPASETTRRKYGDCKDMATVLLSLLEAEETPATLAVVRTRSPSAGLKVDPLPTLWFFNHMVVCARSVNGPVWLDATHRYGTAAHPRSDIQGASAFMVSGPDAGYQRIPVNDPESNRTARTIRLQEKDKGRWTVDLDLEWVGGPAQDLRFRLESGIELVDVVERIVEDLECTPIETIREDMIEVHKPAADLLRVGVAFAVRPPVNNGMLRPTWEREPYPIDVFSSRSRKTDVYWPLPGLFIDTLIVEPSWVDLADLPDTSVTLKAGGIVFHGEQRSGPGRLQLVRSVLITDLVLPVSSWKTARDARGRLMRWSSQNLIAER